MDAILDTTVIIHLWRRYKPALAWFNNPQVYGVTTATWLEVMEGSTSKIHQTGVTPSSCGFLMSSTM